MDFKQAVKDALWNYSIVAPNTARNENWAPIAFYGASRPTLENVGRGYYENMLNSMLGNTNNPQIQALINNAIIRNREKQRMNQMQYGASPLYPLDWDDTRLPMPMYPEQVNYDL